MGKHRFNVFPNAFFVLLKHFLFLFLFNTKSVLFFNLISIFPFIFNRKEFQIQGWHLLGVAYEVV